MGYYVIDYTVAGEILLKNGEYNREKKTACIASPGGDHLEKLVEEYSANILSTNYSAKISGVREIRS